MTDIGMYIIYSLIVYAFIAFARHDRNITKSFLMGIIIANVISLNTLRDGFATGFVQIFIYEAIICAVTLLVMKFLEALSNMNMKTMLFVIELIGAFGIVYLYTYMNTVLITLI